VGFFKCLFFKLAPVEIIKDVFYLNIIPKSTKVVKCPSIAVKDILCNATPLLLKFFTRADLTISCKEDKYPYLPFTVVETDEKWFTCPGRYWQS